MRQDPVSEAEATRGPDQINPAFFNRFERYAEDASSDDLRQRWGRILAGEIRKPGRFSQKVLRIVDELEPDLALLFEEKCKYLFAEVWPRALVGDLSFHDQARLTHAGLLTEPGLGQARSFNRITTEQGAPVDSWILYLGDFAIAIPTSTELAIESLSLPNEETLLVWNDDKTPGIPVYVLTAAGSAISTILPNRSRAAFQEYASIIRDFVGDSVISLELIQGTRNYKAFGT